MIKNLLATLNKANSENSHYFAILHKTQHRTRKEKSLTLLHKFLVQSHIQIIIKYLSIKMFECLRVFDKFFSLEPPEKSFSNKIARIALNTKFPRTKRWKSNFKEFYWWKVPRKCKYNKYCTQINIRCCFTHQKITPDKWIVILIKS